MPGFADRMSKLGVEGAFIVLARAKELERQGKKIIHCEIGQPDFDTPAHIKEAAKKALDEGFTGYTPSAGIMELREAIAEYVSKTRGIDVTPDQVVVTVGAKIGIFSALMAFVNPGEEVIIPMPAYPSYESVTEFVGGVVKPVVLKEEREFSPSGEEIAKAVTDRTKVIVINTPSNPTGGVYKRKDLEAIVEVAKEHDLWIISDEIYEDIIFDGKKHESILSIPGAEERAVMLSGFSKTYAMTGWRLGYVVAPKEVADKITKIQLNTVSCPVSFVQKAGIAALKGPRDEIEAMVREYEERRDLLYREINRIPGFSMIKPAATFYAFPNVKELGVKSKELANMLLEEAGVALLPGTDFGAPGEGYLRLSFATSKENLMEAMERIRAFVEEKFPNVS
ncbi:MAG: pyridoxal phosphate-dependent aminotransferase [Candidatus Korarchaeota archaeon]|nr:pyridoxal phosphate-dependent aminotransferase [Candidatus Korarchaeota archaeon]